MVMFLQWIPVLANVAEINSGHVLVVQNSIPAFAVIVVFLLKL